MGSRQNKAEEPRRTTIVLPAALDKNIEYLALVHDINKGELIREALTNYVKSQGLRPQEFPSLELSAKKSL